MVKTESLYLTWAPIGTGLWQTDTKTDLLQPIRAMASYACSRT